MDTVFIRGLRAEAIIGCYDHERTIRQPLIIDLELATDVASGAATDQLEDALDYAAISQRVIAEVEASSYQLIESLAEHLAGLIRTDFAVPWLRIVVTKPTAVAEADAVGVVIERGSRPQVKVK